LLVVMARSSFDGRGRPVGADSAHTRAHIVRAARAVINERGYPAVTLQAIAKQTALGRPTLHYSFTSREEVFEALAAEVRVVVAECAAEALRHDTALDRLSVHGRAAGGGST
jgi:AcrR family transcriptional regulator